MRNYLRHLRHFFQIPSEIRSEFLQATLQKNQLSLLVICIMIFGMELFNIARVLFWSASLCHLLPVHMHEYHKLARQASLP